MQDGFLMDLLKLLCTGQILSDSEMTEMKTSSLDSEDRDYVLSPT